MRLRICKVPHANPPPRACMTCTEVYGHRLRSPTNSGPVLEKQSRGSLTLGSCLPCGVGVACNPMIGSLPPRETAESFLCDEKRAMKHTRCNGEIFVTPSAVACNPSFAQYEPRRAGSAFPCLGGSRIHSIHFWDDGYGLHMAAKKMLYDSHHKPSASPCAGLADGWDSTQTGKVRVAM